MVPTRKTGKTSLRLPLVPPRHGRSAKKIRGKFHYFGKVADDPEGKAALVSWLDQKDDLLAAAHPRVKVEGFTVENLANAFLAAKRHLLDTQEISPRQFSELFDTCQRVIKTFGWDRLVLDLAPDDFSRLRKQIADKWGPNRLGNEIQRVRSIFKFGRESGLNAEPVYGPTFKNPSRKVLRKERNKKGPRMLEAADLQRVLAKVGIHLKAMVLLGLNCGFGNDDVAKLPMQALDLKSGWVNYPRPKTGILRRCPLWPETIAALEASIAKRPKPHDAAHNDLVFLTKFHRPWRICEMVNVEEDEEDDEGDKSGPKENCGFKLRQDDAVAKEFTKVLKALELHRKGLGFYALRHTFETIGGDTGDQVAVNALMGHVDESMAETYRERVKDERLQKVTNHVRAWLYPADKQGDAAADKQVGAAEK